VLGSDAVTARAAFEQWSVGGERIAS